MGRSIKDWPQHNGAQPIQNGSSRKNMQSSKSADIFIRYGRWVTRPTRYKSPLEQKIIINHSSSYALSQPDLTLSYDGCTLLLSLPSKPPLRLDGGEGGSGPWPGAKFPPLHLQGRFLQGADGFCWLEVAGGCCHPKSPKLNGRQQRHVLEVRHDEP